MEEIKKFIEDDLTNKAKDINSFTQQANEQEFIVCRFLIGWSVASIGALIMFYLQNINIESPKTIMLLLSLREAFLPLVVSIFLGILQHLSFGSNLLKRSAELDKKSRKKVKKIMEEGDAAIPKIAKDLITEYTEESILTIGFKGFLYSQMASFLFGIFMVGYSVIFLKL
ncbi:MAG: hypothetical protein Q7K71_07340 [Candidatus Omnitrophota bacterium]|nr:hypothetical protein [Candidatus Omnitrophota bacterium]